MPRPSLRACSVFATLLAASCLAADNQTGLAKRSPFHNPAGAVPVEAAKENIEFAGVSSVGSRQDLIFYDKTAKKSHWISKGETKEGIAVLSYDERREQARIKLNGVEKILPLRKGGGPGSTPKQAMPLPVSYNQPTLQPAMPPNVPGATPPATALGVSAPVAPTPPVAMPPPTKHEAPPTPETQARQETEARMLVSDLLEIGMAQRKAYEDQQRRAAEGRGPGTPTDPTTANQPPVGQPVPPVAPTPQP